MKSFYLKTDSFWVFSRIIFTLLFIIAVIIVFLDSDFVPGDIIVYSSFGIYISLMITILFKSAYKKPIPSAVKMTTGIISSLIGCLMSYTILINQNIDIPLKIGFHFLPLWIILLGIRDILLYQNNFSIEGKQSIAS